MSSRSLLYFTSCMINVSYGLWPRAPSRVMVSPDMYLKSGEASCTHTLPISFSASPKCPIGGVCTFALKASGYACSNCSNCEVHARGHTTFTLIPSFAHSVAATRLKPLIPPWLPHKHIDHNFQIILRRKQSLLPIP